MTGAMKIDPITLSVVEGALVDLVDEMDLRLIRAALSPIVSQAKDMADGVFDLHTGEMVAQGRFGLPIFVPMMQIGVRRCIELAEASGGFAQGDVWITNDVYACGTHLNDFLLITPYFRDGEAQFVLASCAHMQDIGGNTPGGWNPQARDIHQEGIQVPFAKLYQHGEINQPVQDFLLFNVRLRSDILGDLTAMTSALREGARRLDKLVDRRGIGTVQACARDLAERAERLVRAEIARIPDGDYDFTDYLDNDGITDEPIRIQVRVTVAGDSMHLDFTGTSPAPSGPTVLSRPSTIAACEVAFRHLFPEVPLNGGASRPYSYDIPAGSALAVEYPQPVSGYLEPMGRVIESVMGALGGAIPDVVPAGSFGTSAILTVFGRHSHDDSFFSATYPYPGGYGGSRRGDGLVHAPTPQSMARALGLEMVERRFPIIHDYWSLRPDSGGAGRYRGGCGSRYGLRVTQPGCAVTVLGDRMDHPPYGLEGGLPGAPNLLEFQIADQPWWPELKSKVSGKPLAPGDTVHLGSPGGGGYGRPEDRDPALIERDLDYGYITAEAARRDYGVDASYDEITQTWTVRASHPEQETA
jgi:N-methylhydantoinase B